MLMKSDVVGYVIDSVKRVTSRIRNMRQYLLTSLFNATDTIGYYYGGIFMNRMRAGTDIRRRCMAGDITGRSMWHSRDGPFFIADDVIYVVYYIC